MRDGLRFNGPAGERPADGIDWLLIVLYLLGIYLGVSAHLPGGVPVPAVLAGFAGLLLAAKNLAKIKAAHFVAITLILVIAALSILVAEGSALLPERFKGFVQLSYSLIIGSGFFLAARRANPETLSRLFLLLSLAILAGSLAEVASPAFKAISDSFRGIVFEDGVYAADRRDLMLYGRVRPKLFTSEPSFLSFGFTLFAFSWYVLSRVPGKLVAYLALLAAAYALIRGPTILLGVALVPVYEILLAARRDNAGTRRPDGAHMAIAGTLAIFLAIIGTIVGWEVLSQRIDGIMAGRDPSFFARIIAPAMIAFETVVEHPIAGVGLTGWEALNRQVAQLYATTDFLSIDMTFDGASKSLTNYFWTLWIFLGLVGGSAMMLAMHFLLGTLGASSRLFCWGMWIAFGQAAGGFVGPRTWTVLFLAAALSVLHERARTSIKPRAPGKTASAGLAWRREPSLEAR